MDNANFVISIGKHKQQTDYGKHIHFHFSGTEVSAEQFIKLKEFIELSQEGYVCLWDNETGEVIEEYEYTNEC